jgi:hypothetical protein
VTGERLLAAQQALVLAVSDFGYVASDIKVICGVEKLWEKIFKTCFKAQKQHLSGGVWETNGSLDTLSLSRDLKKGILKAGTLLYQFCPWYFV